LPVDDQLERLLERGLGLAWKVRLGGECLVEGEALRAEDRGPLRELAGEVGLPRLDLALELVPPGGEPVDPGDDRVLPAAELIDGDLAGPAVVAEVLHRRLAPLAFACGAQAHRGTKDVVAVGEDRGAHVEALTERPLGRPPAAIEARPDIL